MHWEWLKADVLGAPGSSLSDLFVTINARREAHKTRRSPDQVIPSTPTLVTLISLDVSRDGHGDERSLA